MSSPRFIYKIIPSSSPPPSPLPTALPVSPLDSRDGFIHLSTSSQILGTLQNFFKNDSHVFILRIPYERVSEFVKWEGVDGKEGVVWGKGIFPHVYANGVDGTLKLGRDEVESVGKWERGSEGWQVAGWPFVEDTPR